MRGTIISRIRRAQIAAVAVARELVGFQWAVMQDCPVPAAPPMV
jgi:hypothetical protein